MRIADHFEQVEPKSGIHKEDLEEKTCVGPEEQEEENESLKRHQKTQQSEERHHCARTTSHPGAKKS